MVDRFLSEPLIDLKKVIHTHGGITTSCGTLFGYLSKTLSVFSANKCGIREVVLRSWYSI